MKTLVSLALVAASGLAHAQANEPVELATFAALARPSPSIVIPYGARDSQAVDVFLPAGPGPHPVAILIHGGCWSAKTAGREQLRHLGAELADRGIAVWSIGYRRADEEGGGYPGTFQDVARAVDQLKTEAERYRFDLSRTVAVGHSAGGHLALWAAARGGLPEGSVLRSAQPPFIPRSVISLAGVGDLQAFARFVPLLCGPGVIDKLVPAPAPPALYAEISPAALPPAQGRVVMFSGILDRLVPPYVAHDFERAMHKKHGKTTELVDITGAGHFDFVTPGTTAWGRVRDRIEAALSHSSAAAR